MLSLELGSFVFNRGMQRRPLFLPKILLLEILVTAFHVSRNSMIIMLLKSAPSYHGRRMWYMTTYLSPANPKCPRIPARMGQIEHLLRVEFISRYHFVLCCGELSFIKRLRANVCCDIPGGGVNSLPSSRASSRCSDISEDPEAYSGNAAESRTTPSGTGNIKSRIPLSRNSSIKKPSYY